MVVVLAEIIRTKSRVFAAYIGSIAHRLTLFPTAMAAFADSDRLRRPPIFLEFA
jgi:hypothetical protein